MDYTVTTFFHLRWHCLLLYVFIVKQGTNWMSFCSYCFLFSFLAQPDVQCACQVHLFIMNDHHVKITIQQTQKLSKIHFLAYSVVSYFN